MGKFNIAVRGYFYHLGIIYSPLEGCRPPGLGFCFPPPLNSHCLRSICGLGILPNPQRKSRKHLESPSQTLAHCCPWLSEILLVVLIKKISTICILSKDAVCIPKLMRFGWVARCSEWFRYFYGFNCFLFWSYYWIANNWRKHVEALRGLFHRYSFDVLLLCLCFQTSITRYTGTT